MPAPLTLLILAVLAIAAPADAGGLPVVDQVQGTVHNVTSALPQPVQQTANAVSGPVDPVIDQAQTTIDQVQHSLGPAQGPTQGPVDQTQGTVDQAQGTIDGAGSPSGSGSGSSAGDPASPSAGSGGSSGSGGTPRASGGSAARGSRGSAVRGATTRTGRATIATARAAALVAAAAIPPNAAALNARDAKPTGKSGGSGDPVTHTLTKLVKVVPGPIKIVIALLATLAALLAMRSWLNSRRARKLELQREELLGDVGLLQRALLPEVPERIGPLATSVAYRPADGPAAGGDFYDVFEIEGGRVAVIVGDVCGHGRQALAQTALIRYTLRAYIDAGLGPRNALQVAGRALANDLAGELTTVVVAVYDPDDATLTYACAGHEPPILLGPASHEPVVAGAAPPVGAGIETGMRETRVPLPAGASACFFTDGLVEARVDGGLVGRRRLTEMVARLGDGEGAGALLKEIADTTQRAPDDMAACIIHAVGGAPTKTARVDLLEIRADGDWSRHARAFLKGAGIEDASRVDELLHLAQLRAAEFGAAVLRVTVDGGAPVADVVEPEVRGLVVLPPIQPGGTPDTVAL